jgi:hypothetical protein
MTRIVGKTSGDSRIQRLSAVFSNQARDSIGATVAEAT